MADALLIVISGALLITPGFLTDIIGFTILIPVTRSLYRRGISRWFKSRIHVNVFYQQVPRGFDQVDASAPDVDPWEDIVEGKLEE